MHIISISVFQQTKKLHPKQDEAYLRGTTYVHAVKRTLYPVYRQGNRLFLLMHNFQKSCSGGKFALFLL